MRQIADKWLKFNVLRSHEGVARHIPETRRYTVQNLQSMLARFGYVVIKPLRGTGGEGVVKIERLGKGVWLYHYGHAIKKVSSFRGLVSAVHRIRRGRSYIIQRGIRLASVGGRPVDYRVKLVKVASKWQIRAVVARVARPGLFVTNLCRGGSMRGSYNALRSAFPSKQAKLKKLTMTGVARTGTYLLERRYPGIGSLGFDFGVDRRGNVWIFEVNTKPQ